jgi:nucleotide-binding universal stress UspA family protein
MFSTNLDERAWKSYEYAVDMALHYNAKLYIIHVVEDLSLVDKGVMQNFIGADVYEKMEIKKLDEAKQTLVGKERKTNQISRALHELYGKDINAKEEKNHVVIEDIIIAEGSFVDQVRYHAARTESDIIVLGVSKPDKIIHAFEGGKILKIMHEVKRPVLIVPLDDN